MKKWEVSSRRKLLSSNLHIVPAEVINNSFARYFYLFVPFFFFFFLIQPANTLAATCEQWIARVVSVEGRVDARLSGAKQWQAVRINDTYCAGDTIRILDNSRTDIALANQPLVRLDQNSTITFGNIKEESSSITGLLKGAAQLDLVKGVAHFFSRLPRNLEVRTAFVNAGVEGTEFLVKVENNQTFISVFEGKVLASNTAGNLGLTSGQSAVAAKGKAPVYQTVVKPRDAVHWALHYPPVFSKDPGSLTGQAAKLLSVGRVDEAGKLIEQAVSSDSTNSDALALQSIIAVVQNEKRKALDLAGKAVKANENSAAAHIALSYARQADFDLEGARSCLEKAVRFEPDNALAWARLAEIQSSFGELDNSLGSAQKAVELDPGLSRTQTVLGYAFLVQVKTDEAKKAFDQAIELDQADSLPRLGLGLAKIRCGQLEEGRRDIEIAASLNPNSSIIRSYLGKAYYEEKRSGLDEREYAIAKELDPQDPTPWFYDAIQKQTTNRPVEALQDLQKAIELNDNRAVYRSKLMLDSDLAARSASVARIYSDLGFQQRALAEGWNSVNTDPGNFSAHRFLADSYSALPRHEIARVSELLQSQLLQPNNITPIQPRLAESNLFLISAGGAAQSSFNEYGPLFNRDRFAVQANGLVGENSSGGGEAVVSGIKNKASFSVGYSHFETDGFRTNFDQEDDIANAFLQIEISPQTSFQAEYRYRDNERGDVQLRFFEDDFLANLRQKDETDTLRAGFRHAFTPASVLLGNFSYQQAERSLIDLVYIEMPLPPPLEEYFGITGEQDAFSGEIEHIYRSEKYNLVSGIGFFRIESEDVITDEVYDPFFDPPILVFDVSEQADSDIDHFNLYLYSYLNFVENVTITVGASGDIFEQDDESFNDNDLEEEQFNPKLGVTWNPVPNTTIRGALFRTLKRTLITDQTLEPTQVAGFNQFYDDLNTTTAWHYGAAIDQKFSENLFGGVEYFYRDLEVPYYDDVSLFPAPPDFVLMQADWEENVGRAYLYWTPLVWLALRAEYQYEKFERDEEFSFNVKEVKTHKVPLGVNFFHPCGASIGLKATYFNQKGEYERQESPRGFYEPGEDDFWVVDAVINYRLPKRYGFLTIGVSNLFDEQFEYADTDFQNASVLPESIIFGRITLAFP